MNRIRRVHFGIAVGALAWWGGLRSFAQDVTPPAKVGDFQANAIDGNSVELAWIAPADDVSGTYFLAYMSEEGPIDNDNWDTIAVMVPWGFDLSGPPGTQQMLPVTGLFPQTHYWFAIWAYDFAFNESEIANADVITPAGEDPVSDPDASRPGTIRAFAAIPSDSTSITLTWVASGDDGYLGTATVYDIRINGIDVLQEPAPGRRDSLQSMIIGSDESPAPFPIQPGRYYTFSIRVADEAGQWSDAATASALTVPLQVIPDQLKPDGTAIPPGGLAGGPEFAVQAVIRNVDNLAVSAPVFDAESPLKLQVEVRETGTPFEGVPTSTSPPANLQYLQFGGYEWIASVDVSVEPDKPYHWQARVVLDEDPRWGDTHFFAWDWVCFGDIPDDPEAADVLAWSNENPVASLPGQYRGSSGAGIDIGEALIDEPSILLQVVVGDSHLDLSRLEVEVRSVLLAFTGDATDWSPMTSIGGLRSIELSLPAGAYHWQFRAVDAYDARSEWESFGGNPETAADFELQFTPPPQIPTLGGSTGKASCLQSTAGGAAGLAALALLALRGVVSGAVRRRSP